MLEQVVLSQSRILVESHVGLPDGVESIEAGRLSLGYTREDRPDHPMVELDGLRACGREGFSASGALEGGKECLKSNLPVAKQKKKTIEQAVTVYH